MAPNKMELNRNRDCLTQSSSTVDVICNNASDNTLGDQYPHSIHIESPFTFLNTYRLVQMSPNFFITSSILLVSIGLAA